MRLKDRTVFYRTPGRDALARSHSYYTRCRGGDKLRMDTTTTSDDNIHSLERAFSCDHGRSSRSKSPPRAARGAGTFIPALSIPRRTG